MNLTEVAAAIANSYTYRAGHPSRIGDPQALHLFLTEITAGVHMEPAAELAGIASNTVRNWLKRGDTGEEPYSAFLRAFKRAQGEAEARVTKNILKASEDPRFWAAGATYLERTHPDRWARRSEDSTTPKVIVQIGVNAQDVQVQIATPPTFACSTQPLSEDFHTLTGDLVSDNQPYGALSESMPDPAKP